MKIIKKVVKILIVGSVIKKVSSNKKNKNKQKKETNKNEKK